MIRRIPAFGLLTILLTLAMASPAAADNCGGLTDCLPTAKSLLIALGAVLVIAGVVAIGFGGAALLAGALGGGGLTGGLSLAGGGVIASAGALSIASPLEISVAGALTATAGVMMANVADSAGSAEGSAGTGSSGGGPSRGVPNKPPAEWPQVRDTGKLRNIVDALFKGTRNPNRVGDGTTMDAIRNELATGTRTAGKMHLTKGPENVNGLRNWLARNPNASPGDRKVAQQLLDDLLDALAGKP